jgi:hypothetical protein
LCRQLRELMRGGRSGAPREAAHRPRLQSGVLLPHFFSVSRMPARPVVAGPARRPSVGAPLSVPARRGPCHGLRWYLLHGPYHA